MHLVQEECSFCFPAHFNRSLISSVHLPDRHVKVTGSKSTFSPPLTSSLFLCLCSPLSCASELNFSSHCGFQWSDTFSPLHCPQLVYLDCVSPLHPLPFLSLSPSLPLLLLINVFNVIDMNVYPITYSTCRFISQLDQAKTANILWSQLLKCKDLFFFHSFISF